MLWSSLMSNASTNQIRVQVVSRYVPERSDPLKPSYFFAYRVTVSNEGDRPVRLVSRHWRIRDAYGRLEEVRGPGVVGKQPRLTPGESFEYTSYCPLPTEFGSMEGSYYMVYDEGDGFEATIARFQLVAPQAVN